MAKKPDVTKLNGISIYHDDKGKVIYSPWFSKTGYVLHDENVSEFQNYGQSYLIAIIVFLVIYYFTHILSYALLLAIAYLGVSIFMFYKRCLKKVPKIYNFPKPHRDNYIIRQAKNMETRKIIVVILASIIMAVYIILNALYQGYKGNTLLLNYAFATLATLFGILYIFILIIKKKNNY